MARLLTHQVEGLEVGFLWDSSLCTGQRDSWYAEIWYWIHPLDGS